MYKTIPELFFEASVKHYKTSALLHKKEGVYFPISYRALANRVFALGYGLQKFGVAKGDTIAILSENRPEWVIADLAIMALGAVSVPLHTTLSAKALGIILNHCRAKILIVSNSDLLNRVLLSQKDLKFLEKIVFLEKITDIQKKTLRGKIFSWEAMVIHHKGQRYQEVFLESDDPCTIIYTSGTTGKPKGVVLSHSNIISNVMAVNEVVPVKDSDIFLSFLPLSHVLERTIGCYMPLLFGATIAYAENVKQISFNTREVMATILISVPRVFEKFYDSIWDKVNASSPFRKKLFRWAITRQRGTVLGWVADMLVFRNIRKKFGGKLRLAISGGASLSENLAHFFSKIGITILEGYGLTETSPVISTNREGEVKFGTVGKVIPGTKVKISEGKEVLVRGPGIFSGYYNDPKTTKGSFDKEGWFHTGDLGFIDAQGFLTITGREKEMFVLSGGKNIWPEPIENLLNNDKFILQSVVVGNKEKFVGALIVPDWPEVELYLKQHQLPMKDREKLVKNPAVMAVFQERLDKKINPGLSDVEKIKKFVLLPGEITQENDELTPTLKLRRHIIEKHHEREIKSLYL